MDRLSGLPFSPSAERNKEAIVRELAAIWRDPVEVLEIGCGTGQHCLYFVEKMPHLKWLPTDKEESLPQIQAWLKDHPSQQVLSPEVLDFSHHLPSRSIEAAYSSNTFHIMSWESCLNALKFLGESLYAGGLFILYGPFRQGENWFGEGNKNFHQSLQNESSEMGIRKLEDIEFAAKKHNLVLEKRVMMPANNQLLIWRKVSTGK